MARRVKCAGCTDDHIPVLYSQLSRRATKLLLLEIENESLKREIQQYRRNIMGKIRCKFTCQSITRSMSSKYNSETKQHDQTPLDTANLYVVTSGSDENKEFFASTPSGKLEVGVHVPGAFEVGKEYYVDIIPAES